MGWAAAPLRGGRVLVARGRWSSRAFFVAGPARRRDQLRGRGELSSVNLFGPRARWPFRAVRMALIARSGPDLLAPDASVQTEVRAGMGPDLEPRERCR